METLPFVHLFMAPAMLIFSWFYWKYPPKERNHWFGYRTPASMRNQNTWKEANTYAAKWMFRLMWGVLAFVQIPTFLFTDMKTSLLVSTLAFTIALVAVIPMTEIHLRKVFNNKGEWKEEMV